MSTTKRGAAALLGIAVLAGLGGCAQGQAGASSVPTASEPVHALDIYGNPVDALEPTESTTPTPTPTPTEVLSRDAELAVERCTDALDQFGTRLHLWVAEPVEWSRAKAEDYLMTADDACEEAGTQVGVDGFHGAALMIAQQNLDRTKVRLAISMGNPEPLTDAEVDYYSFPGPITDWATELKVELGIYPQSALD